MLERNIRVAVVGAGMAGLTCARLLHEHGVSVRVLDKGRGPGGRLSTRRTAQAAFDHGAPRFTARSDPFRAVVETWRAGGVVEELGARGPGDSWYVPTPSATALPRELARGLDVVTGRRVERLVRQDGRWWLSIDGHGQEGPFDRVALTPPAPQAASLLREVEEGARLAGALDAVAYGPCWALMLELDGAPPDAAPIDEPGQDGVVALVSRQDRLPARVGGRAAAVVHASEAWSRAHLERAPEDVARALSAEALHHPSLRGASIVAAQAHRWRYARVTEPLGEPALLERGLGVAGDGLLGPRVELAWQSGRTLAGMLLAELGVTPPR